MGIAVWLYSPKEKPGYLLDEYPDKYTVEDVLTWLRQHWNEEPEGSQAFVLTDDQNNLLATVHRAPNAPEIAITTYADGRQQWHRCHYALDEKGSYGHTEVTELHCADWAQPFTE